jgi:hypothetical protein
MQNQRLYVLYAVFGVVVLFVALMSGISLFTNKEEVQKIEMPSFSNSAELRNSATALDYKIEIRGTTNQELEVCASITKQGLNQLAEYLPTLERVIIHNDETMRRGLSNAKVIYMRCLQDAEEYLNVLVHEAGHVVDLGYLKGTNSASDTNFDDFGTKIKTDDPSFKFYNIAWENNTVLRDSVTPTGFASIYGSSDPFEDFAESFMMYVRYGDIFYQIAENNDLIGQKYQFMKSEVFNGLEFRDEQAENSEIVKQLEKDLVYDATRIPYKLEEFL